MKRSTILFVFFALVGIIMPFASVVAATPMPGSYKKVATFVMFEARRCAVDVGPKADRSATLAYLAPAAV